MTDVSILIPHYNRPEILRPCLESIANLSPLAPRHKTIVIDDGSTDDSVGWIHREFPAVHVVPRSENGGFIQAIESGIEASDSPILVFLNNDTRVESSWLHELADPLLTGRTAGAVGSILLDWEGTEAQFKGATTNHLGQGFEDRGQIPNPEGGLIPVLCACGGAMAIPRNLYVETGGFDPSFGMILEDLDLGWRLNLLGYDCSLAPASRVYHQGHTSLGRESFERKAKYYLLNPLRTVFKNSDPEDFLERMQVAVSLTEARERVCLYGEKAGSSWRERIGSLFSQPSSPPLVSAFVRQEEMSRELATKRQFILERRKRTTRDLFERFVPHPRRPWFYDGDQEELLGTAGYWELERRVYNKYRLP